MIAEKSEKIDLLLAEILRGNAFNPINCLKSIFRLYFCELEIWRFLDCLGSGCDTNTFLYFQSL